MCKLLIITYGLNNVHNVNCYACRGATHCFPAVWMGDTVSHLTSLFYIIVNVRFITQEFLRCFCCSQSTELCDLLWSFVHWWLEGYLTPVFSLLFSYTKYDEPLTGASQISNPHVNWGQTPKLFSFYCFSVFLMSVVLCFCLYFMLSTSLSHLYYHVNVVIDVGWTEDSAVQKKVHCPVVCFWGELIFQTSVCVNVI